MALPNETAKTQLEIAIDTFTKRDTQLPQAKVQAGLATLFPTNPAPNSQVINAIATNVVDKSKQYPAHLNLLAATPAQLAANPDLQKLYDKLVKEGARNSSRKYAALKNQKNGKDDKDNKEGFDIPESLKMAILNSGITNAQLDLALSLAKELEWTDKEIIKKLAAAGEDFCRDFKKTLTDMNDPSKSTESKVTEAAICVKRYYTDKNKGNTIKIVPELLARIYHLDEKAASELTEVLVNGGNTAAIRSVVPNATAQDVAGMQKFGLSMNLKNSTQEVYQNKKIESSQAKQKIVSANTLINKASANF